MSLKVFTQEEAVNEGSQSEVDVDFYEAGPVGGQINEVAITAITATLKDVLTGTTINSRVNQNVKDANGGTLAADGTFTLKLKAADNIIVTPATAVPYEQHELTLKVTYTDADLEVATLNHVVRFWVRNLNQV